MHIFSGNLEENVLRLLFQQGPLSTQNILQGIWQKQSQVSKQGIYRVLRKLRREEKVVMYKSHVSLNPLWLMQLQFLLEGQSNQVTVIGNLRYLQEEEKLSLTIKGLSNLDQLWSHLFRSIESATTAQHPLYLFNPHNWFIIMREETDKLQIKTLEKRQRLTLLTIGGATELDYQTVKMVQSERFQCAVNARLSISEYVAILDDFLIRVKLLAPGNDLIDSIFQNEVTISGAKKALLRTQAKISSRILIERSQTKAKGYKRKLSRDFLIPKALQDFTVM